MLTDDAFTGVIYPEGTDPKVILRSLDTLRHHFGQLASMDTQEKGE
jgi:hypothetical protein